MRAGVPTACFYPMVTEESLLQVARAGAGRTEIFINADSEFSVPFFIELERRAREHGVEILSIHPYTSGFEPFLFFSNYSRRMEDALELYRRYFELTAQLGARFFILHGAAQQCSLPEEEIFARFLRLRELAASRGVRLLQENVARCRSRDPAFIRRMRGSLGEEAEFVLDTKQALRAGATIEEMRLAMGGGLRHIHLSDYSADKDCLLPGRGQLNLRGLCRTLRGASYSGDLILEVYRDSYGELQELYDSYKFITENLE